MRIAYFDCSWGISGDTLLGALIDAGAPLDMLRRRLSDLPVHGYRLEIEKVKAQGVEGTRVLVLADAESNVNSVEGRVSTNGSSVPKVGNPCPPDARQIIACSGLPSIIRQTAGAALLRLARSKGETCNCEEGCTFEHGVCKTERLVAAVGVTLGLSLLGVDRVECSPLNAGGGFVQTERGLMPGLAPSTAQMSGVRRSGQ
jgi:uncharacterized protein (DUF111 family)